MREAEFQIPVLRPPSTKQGWFVFFFFNLSGIFPCQEAFCGSLLGPFAFLQFEMGKPTKQICVGQLCRERKHEAQRTPGSFLRGGKS